MRMKAADTSASRAIADCTLLAVVPRSVTTADIDTFMNDVSTTSTNMAIASRMPSRPTRASTAGAVTPAVVPGIGDSITDAVKWVVTHGG
jgi:hypothetical protein